MCLRALLHVQDRTVSPHIDDSAVMHVWAQLLMIQCFCEGINNIFTINIIAKLSHPTDP